MPGRAGVKGEGSRGSRICGSRFVPRRTTMKIVGGAGHVSRLAVWALAVTTLTTVSLNCGGGGGGLGSRGAGDLLAMLG